MRVRSFALGNPLPYQCQRVPRLALVDRQRRAEIRGEGWPTWI